MEKKRKTENVGKGSWDALWKMSTSERVQIWPSESCEFYLSKPTKYMPARLVNTGGIFAPQPTAFDFPESEGIESAAFALHKKDFYISRRETDAFSLVYILKGKYSARIDDRIFEARKGMFFLVPVGAMCRDAASGGDVGVLWFKIKNTRAWKKIFGSAPICATAVRFSQTVSLASLFADEIYGGNPSPEYLQNTVLLLVENIRREFLPDALREFSARFEKLLREMHASPQRAPTLFEAAKKLSVSQKKLNCVFVEKCGGTFSNTLLKIKMKRALSMLLKGETLAKIAKYTGYSNGYSLSISFKKYYKMSPRNFMKKCRFPRADFPFVLENSPTF